MMMMSDRFDEQLREAGQAYPPPPVPPREGLWHPNPRAPSGVHGAGCGAVARRRPGPQGCGAAARHGA